MRIDRKRKQPVTVLLKALGLDQRADPRAVRQLRVDDGDAGEGPHRRPATRRSRHLPQAAPGRAADRGVRADAAGNLFFNPKRYDLARVGRYKVNKKLGPERCPIDQSTLTDEDIVATIEYLVRLHAGETDDRPSGADGAASRPTTSTTSATAGCAPSAS